MENIEQKNVADSVIDLMKELGNVQIVCEPEATGDGEDLTRPTFYALPKNVVLHDMTAAKIAAMSRLKPLRRTGSARMEDLASFNDWVNRFKGDTSVIYAQITPSPKLTAIIDYHAAGAPTLEAGQRDDRANAGNHRAVYDFPVSQEWKRWLSIHDTPLDKETFGEFIEANARDLLDPTPFLLGTDRSEPEPWEQRMQEIAIQLQGRFGQYAALVQLSRSFQVYETGHLNVTTNRDTGEAQVQFLTEHKEADGAPLRIPNLFMIAIPVFEEGALYRLAVRFRYRKAGESVKFIVSLYNADVALRDAAREAIATTRTATDLPIFMGNPEQ